MSGKIVERNGLKFEVFSKSVRLIKPKVSPMFEFSFGVSGECIDDMIDLMNIAVDLYVASLEEAKKARFIK